MQKIKAILWGISDFLTGEPWLTKRQRIIVFLGNMAVLISLSGLVFLGLALIDVIEQS
jgi:hypothetical protein